MDLFVPDYAIDVEEVFKRGGRGFGDEAFALFKCPSCWQVYLIDESADVAYVDPKNLGARLPFESLQARCVGCGAELPGGRWSGPDAPEAMRLTWDQLRATPWAWVATVETMVRNRRKRMEQGEW